MSSRTTNLNLIKPSRADNVLVANLNDNSDIIDSHVGTLETQMAGKVDKVDGKGLSTNDYTTAEKNKLGGLVPSTQDDINYILGV